MNSRLSYEIIKRILADIGAVASGISGRGLASQELKLMQTISVKYDDKDRQHDLYAGKIKLPQSELKALLVDLSIDMPEYLLIYCNDENIIYAAKAVCDDKYIDDAYMRVYNSTKKDVWQPLSIEHQANMLVNFEKFVSLGLLWEDCNDIDALYKAAIKLI